MLNRKEALAVMFIAILLVITQARQTRQIDQLKDRLRDEKAKSCLALELARHDMVNQNATTARIDKLADELCSGLLP